MTLPAPYYADDAVTIYNADCREIVPLLPLVDLVITSPPYNVNVSPGGNGSGFYTPSRGGRAGTKWAGFRGYGTHDDALPHEIYVAWQQEILTLLWNRLSPTGAIFYNHKPRIVFKKLWTPLELNPGLPLRQIVTWHPGPGIATGLTHFCPSYEWILVFAKEDWRLADYKWSAIGDCWHIAGERNVEHPAPFPLGLATRIVAANRGDGPVLDPFMGSGTTLRAAKNFDVKAIGIEVNEAYCEIAEKRMSQSVMAL